MNPYRKLISRFEDAILDSLSKQILSMETDIMRNALKAKKDDIFEALEKTLSNNQYVEKNYVEIETRKTNLDKFFNGENLLSNSQLKELKSSLEPFFRKMDKISSL